MPDDRGVLMEILDWAKGDDWTDAAFLELVPFTVYLLSTGRNAWWTTWVERYTGSTALYASIEEAKAAAEKQRVQGTVFLIEQVPSLAFISNRGMIIASEFGVSQPFAQLNLDKLSSFLVIGTPMGELAKVTAVNTKFYWLGEKRTGHTFVQAFAPTLTALEKLQEGQKFQSWQSHAQGTGYFLSWSEVANDRSVDALTAIRKVYEERNHEVTREAAHKYVENRIFLELEKQGALADSWLNGYEVAERQFKPRKDSLDID